MSDWLQLVVSFLLVFNRCVHIVATTLLVGGTLFYEWVVPTAIDELRDETRLSVFARMRWAFRWLVYISAALLLISGGIATWRNAWSYRGEEQAMLKVVVDRSNGGSANPLAEVPTIQTPGVWFVAHIVLGLIGVVVAVALVSGGRPPSRPLQWMKINLLVLLLAIFCACATRGMRLRMLQSVRAVAPAAVPASAD